MTALAGLSPYLDLMRVVKLRESVEQHIHLLGNGQGWTAAQLVMHAVLLNIAGGDCVDDLDRLNADAGFGEVVRHVECAGMTRQQRREMEGRFRKGRERAIASPSAMRRFLEEFHDEKQEELRAKAPDKAFIPRPNEHLRGLYQVNWDLVAFVQSRKRQRTATLDIDAVVIETHKQEALYCYAKTKAYQPLNIYWAEHGLVVHSEFRDGNVPAGYQIRRVLDEFLAHLPAGVEEVSVRSDSAAYEIDLLRYLHSGGNGRLKEGDRAKPILFTIGVPITKEYKEASGQPSVTWEPVYREHADGRREKTGQEWAEVGFVPNSLAHSKNDPEFRFIAVREPLEQPTLPGMEGQQKLPFATAVFEGRTYKLHGIVTNRDWDGNRMIRHHYGRCGKSEEAHAVMQEDLAGGQLPSKYFGANAAWWAMMILALNLTRVMKKLVLGGKWAEKRMKAMRFAAINTPGRVLSHARQLCLRVTQGCVDLLRRMREGVAALAGAPG
jgi:hypothetical protein